MLSLLLWCVVGLVWFTFATLTGKAGFDIISAAIDISGRREIPTVVAQNAVLIFFLCFVAVSTLLALGILLLASQRFAGYFFDQATRFAPGKTKYKFAKLGASWKEMHAYFWSSKSRLAKVTLTSIFIWFLHLLQIWMFILALKAWAPFLANLALSPLAILAGLLPLTFAGVGTRDAALVLLYAPYFDAPTAAALGLLCTARYLLPAFAGLPFIGHHLSALHPRGSAQPAP